MRLWLFSNKNICFHITFFKYKKSDTISTTKEHLNYAKEMVVSNTNNPSQTVHMKKLLKILGRVLVVRKKYYLLPATFFSEKRFLQ